MYNFFPFLIAKRQLIDNGIDSTPSGLLIGLMPRMKVPMLQQVILNDSVVKKEIAIKNESEAVQSNSELQKEIEANVSKILHIIIDPFDTANADERKGIRNQLNSFMNFIESNTKDQPRLNKIGSDILANNKVAIDKILNET